MKHLKRFIVVAVILLSFTPLAILAYKYDFGGIVSAFLVAAAVIILSVLFIMRGVSEKGDSGSKLTPKQRKLVRVIAWIAVIYAIVVVSSLLLTVA